VIGEECSLLFGLFNSPSVNDPQLGRLVRKRGLWRGCSNFGPHRAVPLALSGTRKEPDPQALADAHAVSQALASWRLVIEQALFEHYGPYAESIAAGEAAPPMEAFPRIAAPNQVWPHVSLVFVSVTPLSGIITTELAYTATWDEEHTLGARFQSGEFVELCGSVLLP
jgi:hypothetical protein